MENLLVYFENGRTGMPMSWNQRPTGERVRKTSDISGKQFGKLTVVKESAMNIGYWRCVCVCGKTSWVRRSNLINGNTASCGRSPCKTKGGASKKDMSVYNQIANNYFDSLHKPRT
jgi:hypothetical protein